MSLDPRESDGMVVAYLGAAGLQAQAVVFDDRKNPTAWRLPGGLFLVDARTRFNGRRLYTVARSSAFNEPITKEVGLSVAVEVAATFSDRRRGVR